MRTFAAATTSSTSDIFYSLRFCVENRSGAIRGHRDYKTLIRVTKICINTPVECVSKAQWIALFRQEVTPCFPQSCSNVVSGEQSIKHHSSKRICEDTRHRALSANHC